jgi:peptide chain release factor subunit 1
MGLDNLMERLTGFEPSGFPVISLYLNAQANQHGRDDYDRFVRKELQNRARTFEPHTPERESFDRDAEKITRYLSEEVRASANGIAIFACSGADDFFEAVQLDAPLENNRLLVYDRPHLYPLARLMDQYPRYAVLLTDTNYARIFVFSRNRTLDATEIQNVKTHHTDIGGWSQNRYQRHMEQYHLQHAKEVVDALSRIVEKDKAEHVILAGDETTIIPLLREQMPKALLEKVIDVVQLDINTPEHEILQTTMERLRAHDAETDEERAKRLLGEYRADGLAVVGVADTLAALSNGQVEELLISASLRNISYDEKAVGEVLEAYAPVVDVAADTNEPRTIADELVARAQQLSAARVRFIEDDALLKSVGGAGAFLRYKMEETARAAGNEQA